MYVYCVVGYVLHIHDLFYVINSYILYICRIVCGWRLERVSAALVVNTGHWFMCAVQYGPFCSRIRTTKIWYFFTIAKCQMLSTLRPSAATAPTIPSHPSTQENETQKAQTHTKYCIRHQMNTPKPKNQID